MKPKWIFIPSFFTFLNFLGGFLSILKSIEGNLYSAAWFIVLAILCDGMDGKLARWTGQETAFGFELDSLADLISSGVAPAVLVYQGIFFKTPVVGYIFCFVYVFAGGYRLARFNVVQAGDRSEGYTGLPIPVAGFTLASLWIFEPMFDISVAMAWWIVLMLLITLLMISTVHYDWPRLMFKEGWKHSARSVAMLSAVAMMAVFPQWSLFPLFLFYILWGATRWFIVALRGEVSLRDFFLSTGKSLK